MEIVPAPWPTVHRRFHLQRSPRPYGLGPTEAPQVDVGRDETWNRSAKTDACNRRPSFSILFMRMSVVRHRRRRDGEPGLLISNASRLAFTRFVRQR